MRKFVHLSMVILLLSIALTAVGPVVAQEPVAVEEAEAEAEAEAGSDEAEAGEAEHAVAEETSEARSAGHSDQASAPGTTTNTPLALLLTGMVVFFAVGAVTIRRL